jgi:uncharacterized protein with HEPN domain
VSRDLQLWLTDIREACARVTEYVADMSYDAFVNDRKTLDAVVRNLEVIGEAVKQLPEEFRAAHTTIPWRKIAGLRDILAHAYFGIDEQIIWDVVMTKVPDLAAFVDQRLRAAATP